MREREKEKVRVTSILPQLLFFSSYKLSLCIYKIALTSHLTQQAVFVPADDLTDPAPATTFAHLDATTVLSRAISELGIYPAVDPLDSTSRIMDPNIVGEEHYNVARGVQKILQVSTPYEM